MKVLKNRRVGVIGAGISGLSAVRFLLRQGASVFLSDAGKPRRGLPRSIKVEWEGHTDRLLDVDLIVRSPGVPNHLPVLQKAKKANIPVWSELELAARSLSPRDFVAITGTNGKTTTTTLVGKIFKEAKRPTFVVGNIGTPLTARASAINRHSSVICEVSSYQLEDIERFHPTISAILNITPDHLEHHGSLQAYIDAKARIFENQSVGDVCVLNADDAHCRRLAKRVKCDVMLFSRRQAVDQGVFLEKGIIRVRWAGWERRWPLQMRLPGAHNEENALAAVAIAVAAKIPEAAIRSALKSFRGVEHRLEFVRELHGVRYVNDSKATNVDSTRVALAAFTEPLVLIMGGQGKGSPYTPLLPLIKKKARHILLVGEEAPLLKKAISGLVPTEDVKTMQRAVSRAAELASSGDVVLLSPACASFDQYKNYEERGKHFKTLLRQLK